MKKLFFIISILSVTLFSCQSESDTLPDPEQAAKQIDRHGSVELKIAQQHYDNFTVIQTDKIVYDENGNITANKTSYDTVSPLPFVRDTLDTGKTYTDGNGETQEQDTVIAHRKNYQFFISLKKQ